LIKLIVICVTGITWLITWGGQIDGSKINYGYWKLELSMQEGDHSQVEKILDGHSPTPQVMPTICVISGLNS